MAESKTEVSTTRSQSEGEVKSPNLIDRGKEEIEGIIHGGKSPKHHKETHGTSDDIDETTPMDEVKGPNLFERAKEEIEAVIHRGKSPRHRHHDHHHKETHGTSDDIDETTPVDEVKGPSVFQRVKEEIEAVVGAFHPKK